MRASAATIIVALALVFLLALRVRSGRRGGVLASMNARVARAVLYDACIVAYVVWAILFLVEVPAHGAHWVVFSGVVLVSAGAAIRMIVSRRGRTLRSAADESERKEG